MTSRSRTAQFAAPLALTVIVFGLYAQTAWHDFVEYDTSLYLTSNRHVLSGLSLDNLRWAFTSYEAASWHPLTWLSHMLDVELFDLRPAGHHLENVAWHAANSLLILALLQRLGLSRPFAFTCALFFAIHPLRVESVAWVVERKDLLCAFFGLASLLAWVSWSRDRAAWKLVASLGLYACSLMSKSMLVTLPCLLVLLEWWPLGRRSLRLRRTDLATLAFLALSLVTCFLAIDAASAARGVQGFDQWPLAGRGKNTVDAYVWYLAHTFWPTRLACIYPLTHDEPRVAVLGVDIAVLVALGCGAWLARHRLPALLVGLLWFLGTLVPVIGLVQVGLQAHADRFTYFPGLGVLLALGFVAERELLPRMGGRTLVALGGLAALALGLQSLRQIATWRDTETLAKHALEVTSDNYVALDMLGDVYTNTGRVAEALPLLREAERLAPTDPNVLSNLGGALLRSGHLEESAQVLLRASRLAPGRWQVWSLLGGLYLEQQHYEEALAALDRAVALEKEHVGTWTNRGRALEALGRFDEARDSLEHAVRGHGDSLGAQVMLGRVLLRLEKPEEARTNFEMVLRREPQNLEALRGLERVELACGALSKAWGHAVAAARVRPESAPVLADQAWILSISTKAPLADPKAALALAERALRGGGDQPALLDAYALAAAANGDFASAVEAAEKALGMVRAADPAWASRIEKRLTAYRAGRVDRQTPR